MTRAGAAPLGAAALWLHDRTCMSWDDREVNGVWSRSRCARPSHVAMFKPTARRMVAAPSVLELAELIHHQTCPAYGERSHGPFFEERSDRWCGVNSERHIGLIAKSEPVVTLWDEMSR